MFILLKKDEIVGISNYKELLEPSLEPGLKIITEEEYLTLFSLEETTTTDNNTVDTKPSNPSSDSNDDIEESDIELSPVFILEAITDLQTQLEELKEGSTP